MGQIYDLHLNGLVLIFNLLRSQKCFLKYQEAKDSLKGLGVSTLKLPDEVEI